MFEISPNPGEVAILVHEIFSPPTRCQRRWRLIFIALNFASTVTKRSRSLSHITINFTSSDLKAALAHLAKDGSLKSVEQLGGVEELVRLLKSDLKEGINPDDEGDLAHRRCIFGANRCQLQSAKRFPSFFLEAWWDMTAITFLVCAVMSLASGIIEHGLKDGWYDGGSILVAIFLVVAVSAWSEFHQSREFQKLFDQSNDIKVQVVRGGRHQDISIFDVVVGDVVLLGIGDQVPADGLFFADGSLMMDESSVNGETEQVEVNGSIDPFLLSGTKVAGVSGRMLVTSVGMNTIWGEMLSSRICNLTNYGVTPLQTRFKKFTSKIEKAGFVVTALVLVASLIWYFSGSTRDDNGHREFSGSKTKAIDVLKSIAGIVTAAMSISGSLSPVVWLILNYSKWMMKDTAVVWNISTCETLGYITTICTDKRDTLTRDNVELCRRAGVTVKMVTSDNVDIARTIAIECGILTSEEDMENKVMEGAEFRNYSPKERIARIDDIRVMATSSPLDKLWIVKYLKEKEHVVAVISDGTNDAHALLEADIGLSMGIQGTGTAKESWDIVILNGNFESVVKVLKWGRCIYNNVLKFIQFQLTINISALAINVILAVALGKSPLTVVQQMWVNLVMDNLGALALATEPLTHDLMTCSPIPRAQPLITIIMWRDIIAQVIYQVAVLTALYFTGKSTFCVNEKVNDTIMFNTFFMLQVFNLFNVRIQDRKNLLKGIHKSKLFVAIIGIIMVLQMLMVELMNRISGAERLTWGQWGACFGIAVISWPIACIVKWVPGSTEGVDEH